MNLFSYVSCLCSTAASQNDNDEHSIAAENTNQLQDTKLPKATDKTDKIFPAEKAKEENDAGGPANAFTGNIQSGLNHARSLFAKEVPQGDQRCDPNNNLDEQKQKKTVIANEGVCCALEDLLGLGLCSQPSPHQKESDKPAQITIQQNEGDEPSALEVDLGIVATLSGASDGSSTFVATGIVLDQPNQEPMTPQTALAPASDLPKIQRMPISD